MILLKFATPINGESTVAGHDKWITVDSIQFGVGRGVSSVGGGGDRETSNPSFSEVTLTKSMAVELAPERIRVNAICPVIGETGLLQRFMGGEDTPENRARFEAGIPLGRFSRPGDIAAAALYLASDEAAFITGVALEVDGGRCI